jgi:hypothetical protein
MVAFPVNAVLKIRNPRRRRREAICVDPHIAMISLEAGNGICGAKRRVAFAGIVVCDSVILRLSRGLTHIPRRDSVVNSLVTQPIVRHAT